MAETEPMHKKTVFQLKEQLRRQKQILTNIKFIEKLPDKGEKIKLAIKRLEDELRRRNDESVSLPFSESDLAQLEWSGGNTNSKIHILSEYRSQHKELDSDDESEEDIDHNVSQSSMSRNADNADTLRLLATSQISQNQPKIVTFSGEESSESVSTQALTVKLSGLELKNKSPNKHTKFKPNCNVPLKNPSEGEGDSVPTKSNKTNKSGDSGQSKYYESLYPLKNLENPLLKVLSVEESLKSQTESQYKYQESVKSQSESEPRKLYAYDELLKHGKIPMTTFDIIHRDEYRGALEAVRGDDISEDVIEDEHISEDSEEDD